MMYRDTDNSRPMNPQLALRVAIIGGVALVMFGVIFFRLWYLQVLSGDQYRAEANNNRVRQIKIEAPRGKIVDRSGTVLVDNVAGNAVKISPDKVPQDLKGKAELYARLAKTLGVNRRELRRDVNDQLRQQPFSTATVKADAKIDVVRYLKEHADEFPGVTVEQISFRRYPRDQLAAQIVGYVGQVNEQALKDKLYPGVKQGDRVGIAGIESQYDRYLRGKNGASKVQVDALGQPHGQLSTVEPEQGQQLKLTLDLAVQKTGQTALAGAKGAFVVMDVKTGAVRALGSLPSYDPNVFSRRIRSSDYKRLISKENGEPLLNRATTGQYPAGSTFKIVTSLAGLDTGLITPGTQINDPGFLKFGGRDWINAKRAPNGTVNLRKALQVSSDVYYYLVGRDDDGKFAIQKWARRLGFGHTTGIDLPAEDTGLVPTEKWRNKIWEKNGKKLPYRPWSAGDNMNLSVGQGDLLANPLQLAVAYAAIGNGGYVVKPHLAERVEDADGAAVQEFATPPRKKLPIKEEWRAALMGGLHDAAMKPGGTSYPVFGNFPVSVAGKTGTAERGILKDQSWYAVLAPADNPRYVVTVTSESGGFGAEAAAPAACKILSTLLNVRKKNACSTVPVANPGAAAPTGGNAD